MGKVSLIQPRHTYAPNEGKGHVYTPTSLWIAGARILEAGGEIADIQDGNLHPLEDPQSENVGIHMIGSAYVPTVRRDIISTLHGDVRPIPGGRTVDGFVRTTKEGEIVDQSQLYRLFGKHAVYGNHDGELSKVLELNAVLPPQEQTSLIPIYERIADPDMQEYLSTEISFYLSQGCARDCTFCGVIRTFKDPVTGEITKVQEQYRDMEIVEKDLRYLVERAKKFGLKKLDMYLSNLDTFQTPGQLHDFAKTVLRIKQSFPGFAVNMRGLSTVTSFLNVHDKMPAIIHDLQNAGFHTVGFGVDGSDDETWAYVRKTHNTEAKCIEAVRVAREEYGLTPEALMVCGFDTENEEKLERNLAFMQFLVDTHGAVPRPHVAKQMIPANEGWIMPENTDRVELLLQHPEYFQALDFTALPSAISHPDPFLRRLVWDMYTRMNEIAGNKTRMIYPVSPEFSDEQNEHHRRMNIGRFDT